MEDNMAKNIMDIFLEPLEGFSSSSSNSTSESEDENSVSSMDEKLEFPRRKINRLKNYVESVVASYDDIEFKEHFRLSRKTFDFLLGIISIAKVLLQYNFGENRVDHKKGLLITLWYLSNTETFRQVSDRFGAAKDTVRKVTKKILKYLVSHSHEYIQWPTQQLAEVIENSFFQKSGIHGIMGSIDGSHIKIAKPSEDQESFCNRKGYHSMVLQAVCDHKKRFLEVFFGEPGSQHDARVLRKSNIYRRAEQGTLNIGDYFLLGDSAYPLLNWLIPPFKDEGNLTPNHHVFNYRHSVARVVIEHAFGLLKGRFRRLLHGFENQDPNFIVVCVIGACVLHNICILHNDTEIEIDIREVQEEIPLAEGIFQNANEGVGRRNAIFHDIFGL